MAKVRASASTFFSSDTLDCVVRLPEHATDDLLVILVSKDDATGTITGPAGWTQGGQNNNGASGNNSVRGIWYYKVATSSSESDPTVSSTDSDTWSAVAVSIQGADTTTPIDISNGNGITDSTGNPYPAASVTTTTDDCLVFYGICSDGGVSPVAAPGFNTVGIADSGSNACALAFKVQRAAGASGTCDFYASGQADESVLFTFAVRDSSSGAILPGYPNSDVAAIVRPLKGSNLTFSGDALDANSNNFTQLVGTWTNPDQVYQVDASPLTFTDITAAATNATDTDVAPIPAVEATSDYMAIGYSSAFRAVRFDRASCTAGVAGVMAEEYLSASGTWKAFSQYFDSTNNLTATVGDHQICGWTMPADWSAVSLNGNSRFWMRLRCTTVYTTNPTISQIFISTSIAMHHDTLTGRGDAGVVPLFDATYVTPGFSGNLLSGGAYSMASVQDLSTARLMGTFLFDSPRDFTDLGFRADGGVAFALVDSTNLLKAWTVGAADSRDTLSDKRNPFVIQVNQSTDTSFISNSPTMTDIKRLLLMANCRFGAVSHSWNPLLNVGTLKVSGGGATTPVDYDELVNVANAYPCPLIDRATNIAYCPIQIGGSEEVNFQASGFTLTFPQQATVANKRSAFHCDNNVVGVIIDARAGDTCEMTSAKLTSLSPYVFNFLATASASATYDFAGLVVENATVTLREVFTFAGITFASCPSFTQNGAAIDGCTFSGTKITCDDPQNISNNAFTSAGTGHAIEATAPGTYTFTGNTFTGYGADATTDAAFYNNSGGLVTLNIPVGTAVPTVRNGAGASTTVNQLGSIALTGLTTGTKACFVETGTETLVTTLTESGGTITYSFNSGGANVDIRILGAGKQLFQFSNVARSAADQVFPVVQTDDLVYDGGLSLTVTPDGSTKRMVLGTATCDVRALYTEWVDWSLTSDNLQYFPAFSQQGGADIDTVAGTSIPKYLYLLNSWRVRPQESSHTLAITSGILVVDGGGDPFVDTVGSYVVRINYQQPVQAIVVTSAGGSLTAADVWTHGARELTGIGTSGIASQASVDAVPTTGEIRTELATELARIDVATSTRLAAGDYTAPPSVSAIRSEIDANSTKLDVAVSTRESEASAAARATTDQTEHDATQASIAGLVAPDNAGIAAIKAKTDNLPASPASEGNVSAVGAAVLALNDFDPTSDEVSANIVKVAGLTVAGTGSTSDPWGPL